MNWFSALLVVVAMMIAMTTTCVNGFAGVVGPTIRSSQLTTTNDICSLPLLHQSSSERQSNTKLFMNDKQDESNEKNPNEEEEEEENDLFSNELKEQKALQERIRQRILDRERQIQEGTYYDYDVTQEEEEDDEGMDVAGSFFDTENDAADANAAFELESNHEGEGYSEYNQDDLYSPPFDEFDDENKRDDYEERKRREVREGFKFMPKTNNTYDGPKPPRPDLIIEKQLGGSWDSITYEQLQAEASGKNYFSSNDNDNESKKKKEKEEKESSSYQEDDTLEELKNDYGAWLERERAKHKLRKEKEQQKQQKPPQKRRLEDITDEELLGLPPKKLTFEEFKEQEDREIEQAKEALKHIRAMKEEFRADPDLFFAKRRTKFTPDEIKFYEQIRGPGGENGTLLLQELRDYENSQNRSEDYDEDEERRKYVKKLRLEAEQRQREEEYDEEFFNREEFKVARLFTEEAKRRGIQRERGESMRNFNKGYDEDDEEEDEDEESSFRPDYVHPKGPHPDPDLEDPKDVVDLLLDTFCHLDLPKPNGGVPLLAAYFSSKRNAMMGRGMQAYVNYLKTLPDYKHLFANRGWYISKCQHDDDYNSCLVVANVLLFSKDAKARQQNEQRFFWMKPPSSKDYHMAVRFSLSRANEDSPWLCDALQIRPKGMR